MPPKSKGSRHKSDYQDHEGCCERQPGCDHQFGAERSIARDGPDQEVAEGSPARLSGDGLAGEQ